MVPFSSMVYTYTCYICKIYYISPITLVKHGFLFPLRQSHEFLAGLELTTWSKQDPELLILYLHLLSISISGLYRDT